MSLLGSGGGVVQGRSRLKAERSAVRGKGRNGEISGEGGGRQRGNFWEEREPERLYGKEGKGKCFEMERERLQGNE